MRSSGSNSAAHRKGPLLHLERAALAVQVDAVPGAVEQPGIHKRCAGKASLEGLDLRCIHPPQVVELGLRYPMWGAFITHVGSRVAAHGQLIDVNLNRDLLAAIARQRLKIDNVRVARDVVLGTIFFGIETMLTEPTHDLHSEQMMCCVLTGFGLPDA